MFRNNLGTALTSRKEGEEKNRLSLRKRVKPIDPNNLDDINAVRGALKSIGWYERVSPGFYQRPVMDGVMEKRIRK